MFVLAPLSLCLAQAKPQAKSQGQAKTAAPKLTQQQKFVLDVVQTAVALPQGDQQDRLRVLTSAANVIGPVQPALAKKFAKEGMRIEQELISAGETPSVSILEAGHVDCAEAQAFVENVPVEKVGVAEQSLIAAQAMCPKQATEPVRRKWKRVLNRVLWASSPAVDYRGRRIENALGSTGVRQVLLFTSVRCRGVAERRSLILLQCMTAWLPTWIRMPLGLRASRCCSGWER